MSILLLGCAGRILQIKDGQGLDVDQDYGKMVQVSTIVAEPVVEPLPESEPQIVSKNKGKKKGKKGSEKKGAVGKEVRNEQSEAANKKKKPQNKLSKKGTMDSNFVSSNQTTKNPPVQRQPEIEDAENFLGRRPLVDPFRPGEKTILNISYFAVSAGELELQVLPDKQVNGEKAHHWKVYARSNNLFSRIYKVDDSADTYVSYDSLLPISLQIHLKESAQLKESRTFFDWEKLKGHFWEKRIHKEKGERAKNFEWDILPFSQNVISAAFYLRTFTMKPGKQLAFRVADEGKNIVFTAVVVKEERLKTDIGEIDTILIKPKITVDGVFQQVGEILVWLSNDDRKFIIRLESKIKIGTIVAKIKSLDRGT